MAYTTINKSTDYFNTLTYTGTGSSSTKSGVGFQPDLTWVKARDNTTWHYLYDAVRTAGSNKEIHSNSNQAEGLSDSSTYGYLSAFTSDGFSTVMGSNTASDGFNKSGTNFVAWNWKANGAGSANTDGSINSTVSVNTTAGFSIVKYVGTGSSSNSTVGHGLGVKPAMIIVKNLGSTGNWVVWHKDLASETNSYLRLDTNAVPGTTTNYWNNAAPTNQVFGVSPDGYNNNKSGENIIAYCFAEKTGYSKFGSYTGNGGTNNAFINTGFKPKFFITKRTSDTGNWVLWDSARTTSNPMEYFSYPNDNGAEGSGSYYLDFMSNGIKIRDGNSKWGANGSTYIYMAFGQSLVGSNNVPCTAR